jgi:hypothetical protein
VPDLEGPGARIILRHAAQLSGVAYSTLHNQARAGRLQSWRTGHERLTTRLWLHAYLVSRESHPARPLPPDYVAPE